MDVWSPDRSADHKKDLKRLAGEERQQTRPPDDIREVTGNLRFPLDFTYHGCPRNTRGFLRAPKYKTNHEKKSSILAMGWQLKTIDTQIVKLLASGVPTIHRAIYGVRLFIFRTNASTSNS